jgi:hypothetical protein
MVGMGEDKNLISDEAVEAAWDALPPDGWHIRDVRAALEAAAPHMLADAWDACARWPSRPQLEDNPYRSQS